MKKEQPPTFEEFIVNFLVTSGCICLIMAALGLLLLPDQQFGYEAFFSPLIFGFLTNIPSLLLRNKYYKNYPALLQRFIHLALIEGIVIGINFLAGAPQNLPFLLILMSGIAAVYGLVYLVLWLNDRRLASRFNQLLGTWQEQMCSSQDSTKR